MEPAGHIGFTLATLFSADGRRVYSASIDGRVHVWDVARGTLLERWSCHDGPIHALRRSADGARLFTASHDGSVGVWDARDGRRMHRLTGHRGGVHGLAVSASRLASGGYDGTTRLWDVASGAPLATLEGHTDAVTTLAFLSPERLASGSRDTSLRLWDLSGGGAPRVLLGHRHWVTGLAALPDRRHVVSVGEDGQCILWDCERAVTVWSRSTGGSEPIWGFALSPDGTRVITGGAGPMPHCWDTASGAARTLVLPPVSLHGSSRRSSFRLDDRSADFSPDGTLLAGGNSDGSIVIYDLERDVLVHHVAGGSLGHLAAAITADGHVATSAADGSLMLHGSAGERRALNPPHAFMAYALCRAGPRSLASGGFDGAVYVRDVASGEVLARFEHGGFVFAVAASEDGSRLLSAGEDAVCIWDVAAQRRVLHVNAIGGGFHLVADLASDGGFVAAGEDSVLRSFAADGAPTAKLSLARSPTSAVRIVPGGRHVAVADGAGGVSLIDLASGAAELLHRAHEDWIRRVQVTPDGRCVVSDSQNGICRIYDLARRRLLDIPALRRPVPVAAVGPRSEIVAVTALGEVVRVDPSQV